MQGDASQGEELVRVSGGSCAARTRTLLHKAEGGGGHEVFWVPDPAPITVGDSRIQN